MSKIKIAVGLITFFYALFIFNYPASYYNDDSLFFVRGIESFSVIDFAPHFPGYPFIVLAGKCLNLFINDAKYSLFILTASCSIILPSMLFFYTEKILDEKRAFIIFLISISSPYLMNFSLAMLSDSVGFVFLFIGLYYLEDKKYKLSGFFLTISLFSRPSYFIFFLIGLLYISFYKKESLRPVLGSFLLATTFFMIYIFINNGSLYLYEGERFIQGHFSLWGVGQNSTLSWYENIFSLVNLPYVLLAVSFFKKSKNLALMKMFFIFYLLWILFAQNADSLRHLIPLIFIANILIVNSFYRFKALLPVILLFNIIYHFNYDAKYSPIDQMRSELEDKKRVILSNRSIEILRESTKKPVVDNFYKDTSNYLMSNKKTYFITTLKPKNGLYRLYNGRFIGEHTFYLILN